MIKSLHSLRQHIKSAYVNLLSMGIRSLLAMLGILVGTGSVVAMVASGQMATEAALERFRALGTDMMSGYITSSAMGTTDKPFSLNQAMKIKELTPDIQQLAAYSVLYIPATYKGEAINAPIIAATQDLANVLHFPIQYGRFISDYDIYEPYCVLGNQLAVNLQLNDSSAVGKRLHIGNYIFTIAGVANPWPENSFFTGNLNTAIIIPVKTVKLLNQDVNISYLVMRLKEKANIDKVETLIQNYMSEEAPDKKAVLRSSKELIKGMLKQRAIFSLLLGMIGGVSLFVGGIGVMNIMLVSVLERRREIGIRLALGATRQEIQWMFISEAIILSITGGIAGIIVGTICSYIIAQFANWSFTLFFWPSFTGFTVSFFTGVFFGYYPAKQAAKLNPIDALREA